VGLESGGHELAGLSREAGVELVAAVERPGQMQLVNRLGRRRCGGVGPIHRVGAFFPLTGNDPEAIGVERLGLGDEDGLVPGGQIGMAAGAAGQGAEVLGTEPSGPGRGCGGGQEPQPGARPEPGS
jgi:hypothetical protein